MGFVCGVRVNHFPAFCLGLGSVGCNLRSVLTISNSRCPYKSAILSLAGFDETSRLLVARFNCFDLR